MPKRSIPKGEGPKVWKKTLAEIRANASKIADAGASPFEAKRPTKLAWRHVFEPVPPQNAKSSRDARVEIEGHARDFRKEALEEIRAGKAKEIARKKCMDQKWLEEYLAKTHVTIGKSKEARRLEKLLIQEIARKRPFANFIEALEELVRNKRIPFDIGRKVAKTTMQKRLAPVVDAVIKALKRANFSEKDVEEIFMTARTSVKNKEMDPIDAGIFYDYGRHNLASVEIFSSAKQTVIKINGKEVYSKKH